MKGLVIVATIVAIFLLLLGNSFGENEDAWPSELKDGLAKRSLADVILHRPLLERAKRSARRFKRWWWCGQGLPGCDPKDQKQQKSSWRSIQTSKNSTAGND